MCVPFGCYYQLGDCELFQRSREDEDSLLVTTLFTEGKMPKSHKFQERTKLIQVQSK